MKHKHHNLAQKLRHALVYCVLLLPMTVWAVALPEAKAAGMVGEQPDGYLGVVKDSADAQALIADINTKRKAAYEGVAGKTNQALDVVEKLAGERNLNKTGPGNYIKYPDGSWQKKK